MESGLQIRYISCAISYLLRLLVLAAKYVQTSNNACASVALLNIVNNVEGIELGEHLRRFKDFTMPFTPALRGDAITNFEFVKQIHNSFARWVLLVKYAHYRKANCGLAKWICLIQTFNSKMMLQQNGKRRVNTVRNTVNLKLASISLHLYQPWARSGNLMV